MSALDLVAAHKHSIFHRAEVLASTGCGCFHCLALFAARDVQDWTDNARPPSDWTALCPQCGIDAVLGDASGLPIQADFLRIMQERWFGDDVNNEDEEQS